MYTCIFKIILNKRINIKISSFVKLMNKIGIKICNEKNVYICYFILKIIFSFSLGIGLFFLTEIKYFELVLGSVILINFIFKFMDGGMEYKNTFIFPFEELYKISTANKRKVYRTQLFASVTYHLITDEILWASLIYLLMCVFTNKIKIFMLINFILVLFLGYMLINIIIGKYMYAIVMKRISLIRFLMYIATVIVIIIVAYTASDKLIHFIKNHKIGKIEDIKLLSDDAYIKSLFDSYGQKILNVLSKIYIKLKSLENILSSGIGTILYLSGILILFNVSVELITIKNCEKEKIHNDMYTKYGDFLKKIFGKNNILVLCQIAEMGKYRWLLSKNFFQITLLEYETLTYIVLLTTAILSTSNNALRLQLLICMNLLTTVTQASELRDSGYAYFSLSNEKEHIKLIKMSLAKNETIWKYKEIVFKSILLIPYAIIFLTNIFISIYTGLPLAFIIVAITVFGLCIFIMPAIQLYMIPLVSDGEYLSQTQVGESFMEEEIANKMQEFPRIFIVVVPMLISVLMLILEKSRNILFICFELIYLAICIIVFYKYMMKIRNRGIDNAVKKVH